MDMFLTLFIVFVLSFILGWIMREHLARRRLDRLMEQLGDAMEDLQPERINIKIELENGIYYAYNADTSDFMGQGTTRKELEDGLAHRFPDKVFAAQPSNLKEVGFQ
jgi:hypothetical protein